MKEWIMELCPEIAEWQAELIEQNVMNMVLHEREACAKVCEEMTLEWEDQPNIAQAELATMMDCALAIRARGEQK